MVGKSAAFFDFDGTVTAKDSFIDFLWFSLKKTEFILGFILLSPLVLLYLTKILPNWKMKELVLKIFYHGWKLSKFKKKCQEYGRQKLPKIIRPEAQEKINWHRRNGHDVAIVTATTKYYLKEWCNKQKIKLIATEMETENGKITGNIKGKICYGEEKARRIREEYNLSKYDCIYAYGNSRGDLPMLNLANVKYYNWKKLS